METKIQEKGAIRYKPYDQNLVIELPVLLSEVVKGNALVRIVDEVVPVSSKDSDKSMGIWIL